MMWTMVCMNIRNVQYAFLLQNYFFVSLVSVLNYCQQFLQLVVVVNKELQIKI